jgi:hypothetical protein
MPISRQRVAEHIPAETNTRNSGRSIARQRRSKQALSTIQAVFSVGSEQSGSSSEAVSYGRMKLIMERVLGSQGRRARLKTDCDYERV